VQRYFFTVYLPKFFVGFEVYDLKKTGIVMMRSWS